MFVPEHSLLVDCLAMVYRIRGLMQNIVWGTCLRAVLVWCTSDLLPWPRYGTIGWQSRIINHWQRSAKLWRQIWRSMRAFHVCVVVDDIWAMSKYRVSLCSFLGGSYIPCFGCSGPLVACHIFFGEPLLDCFGLPVVVPNAPTISYDSGTKLTKH